MGDFSWFGSLAYRDLPGRYDRLREMAFVYAFIMDRLGMRLR